ncbi:unnamed protein product [Ambrosiozyma monospora]|uniref:Unnamed protein product n=1 Tax=Ambrosiozyma monospora TaxID=43982 RepID=A0ACB5SV89_AMBMO|nr:unnamed protein product [Ambrosiozyma monospora]
MLFTTNYTKFILLLSLSRTLTTALPFPIATANPNPTLNSGLTTTTNETNTATSSATPTPSPTTTSITSETTQITLTQDITNTIHLTVTQYVGITANPNGSEPSSQTTIFGDNGDVLAVIGDRPTCYTVTGTETGSDGQQQVTEVIVGFVDQALTMTVEATRSTATTDGGDEARQTTLSTVTTFGQ